MDGSFTRPNRWELVALASNKGDRYWVEGGKGHKCWKKNAWYQLAFNVQRSSRQADTMMNDHVLMLMTEPRIQDTTSTTTIMRVTNEQPSKSDATPALSRPSSAAAIMTLARPTISVVGRVELISLILGFE
jgi:hypothetical protein